MTIQPDHWFAIAEAWAIAGMSIFVFCIVFVVAWKERKTLWITTWGPMLILMSIIAYTFIDVAIDPHTIDVLAGRSTYFLLLAIIATLVIRINIREC